MTKSRLWALAAALALVIGTVGLAACGSSSDSTSSGGSSSAGAVKANPKVVALVPADLKSQGSLTMATDASYPPVESFDTDGKTIIGLDPDLAQAIGAEMGLKIDVQNASFDSILTGIAAGKYDFSMSAFTDTKERQQTVDFVTYFLAGTSFYSKADGPDIQSLDDLCGHSVAVEKGTTQATASQDQDGKCKAAGNPGVPVNVYPDQNGANLAISGGRAEVGMADSPVAAYIVEQSGGQFKLGGTFGGEPYGIAVPKGSGLAKPIQAALADLIANGEYAKILKQWGVSSGAITKPEINGAVS
jgi:polar amino acid transport system substrate-binding protein